VLCPLSMPVTTLGLCFVEGQKSGLCSRTSARNQCLSLSLGADKTLPHCHMLVVYPAFYLSIYILPRDPQGWFRSNILLNSTVSCELVGISFPHTPECPWTQNSPYYARWKCHSVIFGTATSIGMLWQPEGLSEPPDCQSKYRYFSGLAFV
jgi:hypothetical protein